MERSAAAMRHSASVAEQCLVSVSTGAGVFMSVFSTSVARQALYMLKPRGPELLVD